MRRKFISKIILGTMISTTLCTLVPVKASAEWVKDYQNNWYYTQDNQKMTGWKRIDGQLYYFDTNGKMQTGWIQAGNSWYFLQNSGALKTGWINYNKNFYYADSSGVMQTGTINIAGKVYILGDNGVAKTSNTIIDGQFYTIGSNGEVVGMKVPTPDKEFDSSGNVVTVLKNTDNNSTTSPTGSKFNEVIKDQSVSDDDPNQGRTFKVRFKDSNGAELKAMSVKNGKTVDLYAPTKTGYVFAGWDTKSDGSGKSYTDSDSIKVKEDIILYAQWTNDTAIYVDGITVKGSSYVTLNKTTQMTAVVSPSDASNASVTWSVSSGTGKATIDSNGLLTGVTNGTVTVKATSNDGLKVSGMKEVTVSATDVIVLVNQISVTSNTGISTITANGGTLQMKASVLPSNANDQDVTWSIEDRTGSASIDPSTGLVTATSNGTVVVKATANDKSRIVGSTTVSISGQITKIPVKSVTVSGKDSADKITVDSGTLQMIANVLPSSATDKSVKWSVEPFDPATGTATGTGAGNATISTTTGLLTALAEGTVIVKAVSVEDNTIIGIKQITISNQIKKVTKIEVTSGADIINTDGGELQMDATLSPTNAVNKDYTWSVEQSGDAGTSMNGKATIDSNGKLKAVANGTVKVKATTKNGTGVYGSKEITIKNQNIKATSIAITTPNNVTELATAGGTQTTLQMGVIITPSNVATTAGAVTWGIKNITGSAAINPTTGLLTALTNGTVLVTATTTDGSNITRSKGMTISGQIVDVSKITVTGPATATGSATEITTDKGTLQMNAVVQPDTATNKMVTWLVVPFDPATGTATGAGAGNAAISATGLLTAVSNGTVKVTATAKDSTKIYGESVIKISGQVVLVDKINSITATDNNGAISNVVVVNGTPLKVIVDMEPVNATDKDVDWSFTSIDTNKTGKVAIDTNNVLTGLVAGTVEIKATAKDGSGKFGTKVIQVNP